MTFDARAGWQQARSFHHSRYGEAFLAARERSVSGCLPAREVLVGLRGRGAIEQLVVGDGNSSAR